MFGDGSDDDYCEGDECEFDIMTTMIILIVVVALIAIVAIAYQVVKCRNKKKFKHVTDAEAEEQFWKEVNARAE